MKTRLPEDDDLLAAEYVLGLLAADERQGFARRLASDPLLAEAVRDWEEHFISFADGIWPVAAPPRVLAGLQNHLFAEPAAPRLSLWSSLAFWRGLALVSLVVAVALGAWNLRPAGEQPALVAQVAGEKNLVTLVAYYDAAKGELRLNRTEGVPASGRSFELWLVAGKDAPVSLGVLAEDATTRVAVPAALRSKFTEGVLAISDEPLGGSPTGAPTGAVVASGKLMSL